MGIDLHVHSTFSDGTKTPQQIVKFADDTGLRAVSITDHDTVEGTKKAIEAGESLKVEVVPGIEFSCIHGKHHVHLLGYYVDPENVELLHTLSDIQLARVKRNAGIVEKLNTLGIDITLEEVNRISAVGQTGRPHIAQVLLKKKIISSIDSGFTRYLKKGRPAYVGRKVLEASKTVEIIRAAGGIPVLAHPGSIDSSLRKIPGILEELCVCGLLGVEVYYPIHTRKIIRKLQAMAEHYNLVMTGGSDYHGEIRPGTGMAGQYGFEVPDEVIEKLHLLRVKEK